MPGSGPGTLNEAVNLVSYSEDPLLSLAKDVLDDHKAALPDLTNVVILLAEKNAAIRFRKLLLQQAHDMGFPALLTPAVSTVREWLARQFSTFYSNSHKVCSRYQRELILFDVLKQFRSLTGKGSLWQLTDDLLQLFDQLTAAQTSLPGSYQEFEETIAAAYGIQDELFPALGKEARLVHTLWQAWHAQINAEEIFDTEASYLLGMTGDLKHNSQKLYIAGYHHFEQAELHWIKELQEKNRLKLYLHGQDNTLTNDENATTYHPDQPVKTIINQLGYRSASGSEDLYTRFLNTCFDNNNESFASRCQKFSVQDKKVIKDRLSTLFLNDTELHARAIETCVRKWIIEGKNNIGIVTENRRLARRVRALLERANVAVEDYAGWALSTTRAGAVIECWLQCIEEDFPHIALLDILKSPFIFNEMDSDTLQHSAYRLEHDIILQHNVARNLDHYTHQIQSRAEKLEWSSEIYQSVLFILDQLKQASGSLLPYLKGQHNALTLINSLQQSIEMTGMLESLRKDAAGIRIIEMLQTLKSSAEKVNTQFNWTEFRSWIGRNLEKFIFNPEVNPTPVKMMGLGQSRLQKFDALIIASAEYEHLPGKVSHTPFFNNAVRAQLGVSTTLENLTERFHHYRRLLESADQVLITANHEINGEEIPLSPWVEILVNFYQHTFDESLNDEELLTQIHNPATQVKLDDSELPALSLQPAISVPPQLVPDKYSAHSYQQLVDCPYKFFAERCLSLTPKEEIREALSKSDYGERVHQALEAFHHDVEHYPGPFKGPVNKDNRDTAIQLLTEISGKIFARDIKDNFAHSALLSQWLQHVPDYIDWQIQQQENWDVFKTEYKAEIAWKNNIKLVGRLDRIDTERSSESAQLNIIDYKTGNYPNNQQIETGEAVQLPFYTLLSELEFPQPVAKVNYLDISRSVKTGTELEVDQLSSITTRLSERLEHMVEQLLNGKSMTAWGDSSACQYCNVSRLCRHDCWDD